MIVCSYGSPPYYFSFPFLSIPFTSFSSPRSYLVTWLGSTALWLSTGTPPHGTRAHCTWCCPFLVFHTPKALRVCLSVGMVPLCSGARYSGELYGHQNHFCKGRTVWLWLPYGSCCPVLALYLTGFVNELDFSSGVWISVSRRGGRNLTRFTVCIFVTPPYAYTRAHCTWCCPFLVFHTPKVLRVCLAWAWYHCGVAQGIRANCMGI